MPSYLIAGASRGLGHEFLRQLAQDKSNTIIGLVRNKSATEERLARDGIRNVTILTGDIIDIPALQTAASAVAKLVGDNGLDYLINNAAISPEGSALTNLVDFETNPGLLRTTLREAFDVNVVGVANTISAFLPLIKQSKIKKVIVLSSGMADLDLVNRFSVAISAPYTISKAAVNMLVAKYHTAYKAQGILFVAISPGFVDTSEGKAMTPEEQELVAPMIQSFAAYAGPSFRGPITPQESIEKVLKVVHEATVAEFGGQFVSHYGNQQWL